MRQIKKIQLLVHLLIIPSILIYRKDIYYLFTDACDDIDDPSDFLKGIFFKILKEKYCPPVASIDLTETDHEDDYDEDTDSLQGIWLFLK